MDKFPIGHRVEIATKTSTTMIQKRFCLMFPNPWASMGFANICIGFILCKIWGSARKSKCFYGTLKPYSSLGSHLEIRCSCGFLGGATRSRSFHRGWLRALAHIMGMKTGKNRNSFRVTASGFKARTGTFSNPSRDTKSNKYSNGQQATVLAVAT